MTATSAGVGKAAATDEPGDADGAAAEDTGGGTAAGPDAERRDPDDLRPREIVRSLDQYIVGQAEAKRAVAVALRNRVRRRRLADDMRREVLPKNILMIGPTGVGKTEIARRLAKLTSSPFLKVEATKFTEVGYVGRDVESIVRDMLEETITEVHEDRIDEVEDRARQLAEDRILDILVEAELTATPLNGTLTAAATPGEAGGGRAGPPAAPGQPPGGAEPSSITATPPQASSAAAGAPQAGSAASVPAPATDSPATPAKDPRERLRRRLRRRLAARLRAKHLEDRFIDVEVEEPYQPAFEGFAGTGLEEVGYSLSDFFSQMAPSRKRLKRMRVADARTALMDEETDRLIDMDRVYDDAIQDVEEAGIVFIDEVDKICGPAAERGPDVSGEGVQRDLLPLLEGSVVHTRYGSVRTDHILFIAAGAFTAARPSDLIPEFQGRFPIRVELSPLTETDLQRILTEPANALTKQYQALLGTENVDLAFTADGVAELARQAHRVNEEDENIGARRLFTVMEKVLEELSFRAEDYGGSRVVVDAAMVQERLGELVANDEARRYIL
ncbi:MAG TPA: ATP-dependent protease ATPase subunit HslU [Candidatus Binatia bacterium]|nr:ATP-dependent protease ATPase subunit HslU [Candidatus Binatia bacterium]